MGNHNSVKKRDITCWFFIQKINSEKFGLLVLIILILKNNILQNVGS